jgi:hypothetical protein
MKRRKKIWITCAAMVVVVVLCALALLSRPVPYRFLEGSRYEGTEVYNAPGTSTYYFIRYYRMRGTVDPVAGKAQAELTPQDGWMLDRHPGGDVQFCKTGHVVLITAYETPYAAERVRFTYVPGAVLIRVFAPATFADRVIAWFEDL